MQKFNMPKATVKESSIESYLYRQCKKRGWFCEKFTSPNKRSVPDRIITAPGNTVIFVELKAPGKTPTIPQLKDHEARQKLGVLVYVVDTKDGVDELVSFIRSRCDG